MDNVISVLFAITNLRSNEEPFTLIPTSPVNPEISPTNITTSITWSASLILRVTHAPPEVVAITAFFSVKAINVLGALSSQSGVPSSTYKASLLSESE